MAGLQLIGHDVMDTSRLHAILTAAHQADRADTASPGPGEQHRSRMQHGLMGNTGASSDSGGASIPLSELALLSQLQGLNPANAFLQPGLAVQGQAGQLKLPIGLEELSKMGRGAVGMGMGSLGGTPVQSHSHKPTRSTDSRSSSAYASRHQAAEQRRRTRINERLELLRKMVPHAERANTACFLEEVIKYIDSLKRRTVELEAALGLKSAKSPSHSEQQPEQPMANSNTSVSLAPSSLTQFAGLQQVHHQLPGQQSVALPPGAHAAQQHSALLAAAAAQHGGLAMQHASQPQQLQVVAGSTFVGAPQAGMQQPLQGQAGSMLQLQSSLAGLPSMPIPSDMQTTLPGLLQQAAPQPSLSGGTPLEMSGAPQYTTSMHLGGHQGRGGHAGASFQVQLGDDVYMVKAENAHGAGAGAGGARLPMMLNAASGMTIGVGPNGAPTLQLPPGITPEQLLMAAQVAAQAQQQQQAQQGGAQYTITASGPAASAPQQQQQQQHMVMFNVQQASHGGAVQQLPMHQQQQQQHHHHHQHQQHLPMAALSHVAQQLLPAGMDPSSALNGGHAEGVDTMDAAGADGGPAGASPGSGSGTPASSEESGIPVKKRKVLQL